MHHANNKIVFKTLIWPFVVDQIPYIESGTYVAYNDENGGVIQCLKEDIWYCWFGHWLQLAPRMDINESNG